MKTLVRGGFLKTPLRTMIFLAENALWLRLLFGNYLGLKRAFMGTPTPAGQNRDRYYSILEPCIRDLKDPENEGNPQFHQPPRTGKELGVAQVQLFRKRSPQRGGSRATSPDSRSSALPRSLSNQSSLLG